MARSTMANLITRTRLLINDPSSGTPQFTDDQIQDVLDTRRINYRYLALAPSPTYSGSTISYLDYYSDLGDWEDDITLWQYRITAVTPTTSENVNGHWVFAATTLPPVFAIGKSYDIYMASADLLERWAASYARRFDFTSDGQTFRLSQASAQLMALAKTYRQQGRIVGIGVIRTDIQDVQRNNPNLGPQTIDYMAKG
jgi:hypothetical protein